VDLRLAAALASGVRRALSRGSMRWVVRRLAVSALLVGAIVSVAFVAQNLVPGGPGAVLEDPRVPREHRERLRAALGIDRPLPERYVRFVGAALRGDWGVSHVNGLPVRQVIVAALPHTLALGLAALGLELGLGLPLGAWAAKRAGGRLDGALRVGSLVLWSLPSFWFGLALLLAFAVRWPLLPAGGASAPGDPGGALSGLRHLVLPALALGLPAAAGTARFVRSALLEVLESPHRLAARARGLSPRRLFWRHELLPAAGPIVEVAGLSTAAVLSGALAVEIVFSRPGLGRLAWDAFVGRDHPVLLAAAALAAVGVVAASALAELLHSAVDPRLRRRSRHA